MDENMSGQLLDSETCKLNFTKEHKLLCRYWGFKNQPAETARCLVFISHGVAEHSLCYDELAKSLVDKGCLVFSHDHVGHGLSDGDRVHIDDFFIYSEDVAVHVKSIKEKYPKLPCFILGHSMGGTVALVCVLRNPDLFCGMISVAPAIIPNKETASAFKVFLAKVTGRIMPQFQVSPVCPDWVSSDEAVRQKYTEDPLIWHGGLKAKWACCILDAMKYIEDKTESFTLPYLLMHGTEDKLCSIEGSKSFHEKSGSQDKVFKVYEGAYHSIHNEPKGVGDQATNDIISWILSKCSK